MAIITLQNEMSEETKERLRLRAQYAIDHPEMMTGDNIEDLTPEDEDILDRIWDEIGPKMREERRKLREAKKETGQR